MYCLGTAHRKLADIEGFDHVPRFIIPEKHLAIEVGELVGKDNGGRWKNI